MILIDFVNENVNINKLFIIKSKIICGNEIWLHTNKINV